MEKRLFLAIALSILVLMIYSSLFAPQKSQKITTPAPLENLPITSSGVPASMPEDAITLGNTTSYNIEPLILENNDLTLSINPIGAGIIECKDKNFNIILPQTNIGLLAEWQDVEFKKIDVKNGIVMSYKNTDQGVEVVKTYKFTNDKYLLEMTIEFKNISNSNKTIKYNLNAASINEKISKKNPVEQRYLELSISLPDKVLRKNFFGFNPRDLAGQIKWIGVRDRYFCSIIKPDQESESLNKITNSGITSFFMQSKMLELPAGAKIAQSFGLYVGPQTAELINKLDPDCGQIVNYGFFDSISQILLGVLKFLFKISKNWGLAIILFGIIVFIILAPLSIKSFSSMKKMQELQPMIEELRAKFKDNPQKLNKEIMELYREKKVNPFGGCLPLFLQFPIFIALYQSLMRFIDLKGARFMWIKDLAEPDKLFVFKQTLPLIGNEFNILPLIMMISMFIQQKITSGKNLQGGASANQQKMMSFVFSIMFGVLFYHMPAGLVLYWTVNSLLMLVFQIKMLMPTPTKPVVT